MEDQIRGAVCFRVLPQQVHQPRNIFLHHPVVGIHYFKVNAFRVRDAVIDCGSVPSVLLVMRPDDRGMFLCQPVRNGAGSVRGSVIHDQDLHLFPAREQGAHRALHIRLGVVAGHDAGQQLPHCHHSASFSAPAVSSAAAMTWSIS